MVLQNWSENGCLRSWGTTMSGGRDSVELGSVEWAVVTSHFVPSGLFVRLEESGEEAFMDSSAVHNHPLCRNSEYWPDVGERIRVQGEFSRKIREGLIASIARNTSHTSRP